MDGPSLPSDVPAYSVSAATRIHPSPDDRRIRLSDLTWLRFRARPTALLTAVSAWWTHVAFSDREPRPGSPQAEAGLPVSPQVVAVAILFLVAGPLFFARLDSPLLEPEDAIYAEVARQMLVADDWLVPTHYRAPYYEKPPLFYWLVMAGYSVFGVHDWAARLIPCVAALGTILVTYWWGKRSLGLRAGLAGALVLCMTPRFVHQARMITMDGLLCLWVTSALALGQQALHGARPRRGLWLLSATACGLGLLTKGPVAVILVVVPLLAYQVLDRRTARPTWRSWLIFLATALGLALPWFTAVAWRDPAFLRDFFWTHHVDMRFVHVLHPQPVWYYVPVILLGMLPGTLLVPSLVGLLVQRSGTPGRKPPREVGFVLLCCLWCLLFFSVASCKRIGYVLPAMPTLALALGYTLDKWLPGNLKGFLYRSRKTSLPDWATFGVLALGMISAVFAALTDLVDPTQGLALGAIAMAALGWQVYQRRSPSAQRRLGLAGSWAGCGLATFTVLFLTVEFLSPGYYKRFSLRAEVHALMDGAYHPRTPVVCHPHYCDSVSFYLGRDDIGSYSRDQREQLLADLHASPETLVFVKTGRVLDQLLDSLPETLEFEKRGRSSWMTAGVIRRRPRGRVKAPRTTVLECPRSEPAGRCETTGRVVQRPP